MSCAPVLQSMLCSLLSIDVRLLLFLAVTLLLLLQAGIGDVSTQRYDVIGHVTIRLSIDGFLYVPVSHRLFEIFSVRNYDVMTYNHRLSV